MRELTSAEIDLVSGGELTADEAATTELALAAAAFTIGSTGIGLFAVAAAFALYAYS